MQPPKLLSRDQFREGVFARDQHKCVFCPAPAQDAHHILERRLFPNGGYYLENGASVCGEHHLACERTTISVEDVRRACGVTHPVLPEHLYSDLAYDKWGNPVLENGSRLKGELFYDASVQKVLAEGGVLDLFTSRVKYPRTYHLPWSENMNDDDRMMRSLQGFEGERIIITEKMDGENTTLYPDYLHARSIDGRNHPSRNWVKNFWGQICGDIPEDFRVCGENLYAQHSIAYDDLPSYFMGFQVWDKLTCLSWDDTMLWFGLLGIAPVPVLYDGTFSGINLDALKADWKKREGYVIRVARAFEYGEFRNVVGKFVRKDHIQTVKHNWSAQAVVPNKLLIV